MTWQIDSQHGAEGDAMEQAPNSNQDDIGRHRGLLSDQIPPDPLVPEGDDQDLHASSAPWWLRHDGLQLVGLSASLVMVAAQ
jgi:hypothetical protein